MVISDITSTILHLFVGLLVVCVSKLLFIFLLGHASGYNVAYIPTPMQILKPQTLCQYLKDPLVCFWFWL